MLKVLSLAVFSGLVAGLLLVSSNTTIEVSSIKEELIKKVDNLKIPKKSELKVKKPEILLKTLIAERTLTLEDSNMVVLRGPVTAQSVAYVQREIYKMSRKLPKSTPIYLVLDTPGGSVFDGLDLIDFMKSIPQKVHTVTLFAASMGFQIAQNMEDRLIANQGTLMSHRAALNGLGGQLDGELESRYAMIKRKVDYMDAVASKRMKMDVESYKSMIINEYWVHGFDSVNEKAADEVVNIRCGSSLTGTITSKVRTLFGMIDATFSKCPLIKAPIALGFRNVKDQKKLEDLYEKSYLDKRGYVKSYINTGLHYKVYK